MASERTPHGFGDDAESRWLRRRPPPEALEWVQRSLGVTVHSARALRGGITSSIHALRVSGAGGDRTVVLRRYVRTDIFEETPDIAAREARVLELLDRCGIRTPQLLAVDPTGVDTDVPAVLMTHLPGRADWAPKDLEPWLHRLAEVLPTIHSTAISATDGVQPFRPYAPKSWEPPHWLRDRTLWERGVAVFHGPRLDPEEVFIHRDFHPGNVLWQRSRVSGVVDWQAASIGPRATDVWHCRGNLLDHFGLDAADRFLRIWQSMTGADYHPWTEAVMLIDAMTWTEHVRPQHARDLERLLSQRLAELGG